MSVMRFVGETSREAMRKVRAALGDEALILANRPSESGVEILAMADEAVDAMAASQAVAPSSSGVERRAAPPVSSPRPQHEPVTPASAPSGQGGLEAMSERLLREMQDMRALLARQPASSAPAPAAADDRGREALARALREAGFGRAVADDVLQGLPPELVGAEADSEAAHAWLVRRLASRLSTGVDPETFLDTPGILALIGPTGVGKTTTTAKLAARCVQRHGADNVALVTTDGFRVGAHEQLRIYAELLGVPLHALSPEQSMDDLLAELSGRRWVIIDTVGMSQRDQRIIAQAAQLQGGAERVRMLLVLNAASQPGTLEEVVTRYRQAARAAGVALDDALLTKQDEAGQLGPALDTLIRHGLRLRFVSTGQRVPEDLAPAEAGLLIEAALGAARADDDLPVAAARDARPGAEALLGQGRRLGLLLDALRHRLTGFATLEAAWDLSALPGCLQEPRLARLLEAPPESLARPGMLWAARRRLPGADWAMPDLGIDDGGGWLVLPDLQQRQPVGWPGRLERARDAQGVGVHLLPAPPDAETWLWLDESRAPWICQARPGQRVVHGGERLALSSLEPLAEAVETRDCRFRGQGARARFARLAVEAGPGGRRGAPASCAMSAWFATLVDPESGRTLGQRYWLTPLRSAEDALPLLLGRLHGEALPRQVRRAWERLQGTLPAETDREVCQLLAAGLAAAAGHLDQAGDAEAEQLRRDLLSLLGGRRRRREGALLEALLHLLMARDAIRHVGAAGLEGVR
ncbi:flagellar biosynthesis protein FlhF [Halomonas organivorans]|uniref:Flagellar biosynthesis protein FlhF n=1 Tax=Halomonas organivorans TaxID=257772 RepID=A0A7W5BWG8_9GAMM|nr:flagellar biosynthesis protein FlhF [Halomonas organivorans]MBB3140410.1 flagellar biosynthesis protein FlhF [Halomonas organivorans]